MTHQTQAQPVAQKSEYHLKLQDLARSGRVHESLNKDERTELLALYIHQMPANEAPDLLGCMNEIQAKAYASAMSRILQKPNILDQEAVNSLLTNLWLDLYDDIFRRDLQGAIWQEFDDDSERRAERSAAEGC